MSPREDGGVLDNIVAAGAIGFLQKPFGKFLLLELIEERAQHP
jgi:FixJ family two-component response regulator